MGFESLQSASYLAGQLLHIDFLAFDRGQSLQFRFGFTDPTLAALLIPLLAPGPPGNCDNQRWRRQKPSAIGTTSGGGGRGQI